MHLLPALHTQYHVPQTLELSVGMVVEPVLAKSDIFTQKRKDAQSQGLPGGVMFKIESQE